jgi:DNA-binding MarR family transcriptional regulator
MKQAIIDSLIHSIFRFRQIEIACRNLSPANCKDDDSNGEPASKSNAALQSAHNISMAEIIVLKGIKNNIFESGDLTIPDLLCISRAAVSKMLGNMEEKRYIKRVINKSNRIKLSLSITKKGNDIVDEHEHKVTKLLKKIVDEFGEAKTKQLITLTTNFLDTVEKVKSEM